MTSLRWRLLAGVLSGITLLIAAGGAVVYFDVKHRLYADFDRGLTQRAALLAAMIEEEAGQIRIEWLEQENDPPGHLRGIDYFAVWNRATGELLAGSPDLYDRALPRFGGPLAQPELRQVRLPEDRAGRCAGVEFDARRGGRNDEETPETEEHPASKDAQRPPEMAWVQLVVAKVDTVSATLGAIRGPLLGLWLGCTLLGALLVWWVIGQSLRPLDQLKVQIARLEEGGTGHRIALQRPPEELEPVTRELNRLLERVEHALLRERTLTSNVAHELRTPIAGVLSILEVTLSRLRSAEEYRQSTAECFEIAKRMHWLINNLLSITRIESGQVQLRRQPLRLEAVLPEWWSPFAARAEARSLQVEWKIEPEARIETDPEFLRVVVTNLFDNAVSYAPEGGTIRVAADGQGTLSVANRAVGFGVPSLEHVFEPFWRNTESREEAGVHAGLGLSLCKKVIELLGGRISAQLEESENWFVVQLKMA